jgi:hypothetical protein
MAKGKGKARGLSEAQDAAVDDQLASSSDPIRTTRRSEKPKKSKVGFHLLSWVVPLNNWQTCQAPTKKELREARRETARMRSDMRASISTDATRHLDIKDLLKRFDVLVDYYVIAYWYCDLLFTLSQKPTCTFYTTFATSIVGI